MCLGILCEATTKIGFRSSRSTLDLLTFVPDKTARAFDRSAPCYIIVALYVANDFYRV